MESIIDCHPLYSSWRWWNAADPRFSYVPYCSDDGFMKGGLKLIIRNNRAAFISPLLYEETIRKLIANCPLQHQFTQYECWFNEWRLF